MVSKVAEGEEGEEDDDKYDDSDLSEDMWRLRQMQKQELNKVLVPKMILSVNLQWLFEGNCNVSRFPEVLQLNYCN